MKLLTPVVAALAGGGCFGPSCGPPPFPDDSCDDPAAATLTALEIGAGEDDDFTALPDGDVRPVAVGDQGGSMVTVTLRLQGPEVPGCVAQETTLHELGADEEVGADTAPKRTYEQSDGGFTTKYLFIQYEDWRVDLGDALRVRSSAGGLSDEVLIFLDFVGMPDAGVPDASTPDAGGPDAAADAMIDAT